MMAKRHVAAVVLLVVAAVALAILALDRAIDDAFRGGPPPDPTKLPVLKEQGISAFMPAGGTLVRDVATDEHTSFGVLYEAHIRRVFTFGSAESARAGREAAVAAAEVDGWEMGRLRLSDDGDASFGRKQLSTGEATLAIENHTRDGQHEVTIVIEDSPCSVLCDDG